MHEQMDLVFSTKSIEFDNQPQRILLQNENGPCALVALINLLILSPKHTQYSKDIIRLIQGEKKVQLHKLLQTLADIAINITTETDHLDDIDHLLLMLPELHRGLNVNPKFNGEFDKSNQDANELFNVFKVRLVHGWCMDDPSDNLADLSYESAQDLLTKATDLKNEEAEETAEENNQQKTIQEDAKCIQKFLSSTATQLTETGLSHLNDTLEEGEFAVLFRNDHFSTLYKHSDSLYNLVTDVGFGKHQNIVWESLLTVDGSADSFLDGHFNICSFEKKEDTFSDESEEQFDKDKQLAQQLQQEEDRKIAEEMHKKEQRTQKRIQNTSNNKQTSNDFKLVSKKSKPLMKPKPIPIAKSKPDKGCLVM